MGAAISIVCLDIQIHRSHELAVSVEIEGVVNYSEARARVAAVQHAVIDDESLTGGTRLCTHAGFTAPIPGPKCGPRMLSEQRFPGGIRI